jgi:hypothetical protein
LPSVLLKQTNHRRPKLDFVRFGPKADKRQRGRIVRLVPEADIAQIPACPSPRKHPVNERLKKIHGCWHK